MLPLPQALAELSPRLAQLTAPVVEQVAQRLAKGQGTAAQPLRVPTLLTQANRSAGRDRVRTTPRQQRKRVSLDASAAYRACRVLRTDAARQYCDACPPSYRAKATTGSSDAGRAKMAELRAASKDPSKGGEAATKRAASLQKRQQEEADWEAVHAGEAFDDAVFTSEILPQLQRISLGTLAKATGLSVQYCGLVRRGLRVPHPRHWTTFKRALQDTEQRGSRPENDSQRD